MRLTLVSETFWPQTNGVSKVLGRLVEYAKARGDTVQLVIPRYKERRGNPGEVGVPSFAFPLYPEVRVPLPRPGKLWKAIQAFRPDLIHVATEATLGLSVLLKARGKGIPVVSSYHTNFSQYTRHYYLGAFEKGVWNYLRWFHNQGLRTYCPSEMTRRDLLDHGFTNVEVWARGVEVALYSPSRRSEEIRGRLKLAPDDVLAVYVGRLAKEKNLPLLLRVFRRAKQRMANLQLLLVGDGPIRKTVESQAPPGVHCVGYKRGEDLAAHFASGDLFLFPSVTETFGNVVLEALACGLPVVGFEAGGVPHSVHHGENGLLAPLNDEETFQEHFEGLCRDSQRRSQMAKAARAYAETQTWGNIFSGLFASYETVLKTFQADRTTKEQAGTSEE